MVSVVVAVLAALVALRYGLVFGALMAGFFVFSNVMTIRNDRELEKVDVNQRAVRLLWAGRPADARAPAGRPPGRRTGAPAGPGHGAGGRRRGPVRRPGRARGRRRPRPGRSRSRRACSCWLTGPARTGTPCSASSPAHAGQPTPARCSACRPRRSTPVPPGSVPRSGRGTWTGPAPRPVGRPHPRADRLQRRVRLGQAPVSLPAVCRRSAAPPTSGSPTSRRSTATTTSRRCGRCPGTTRPASRSAGGPSPQPDEQQSPWTSRQPAGTGSRSGRPLPRAGAPRGGPRCAAAGAAGRATPAATSSPGRAGA